MDYNPTLVSKYTQREKDQRETFQTINSSENSR